MRPYSHIAKLLSLLVLALSLVAVSVQETNDLFVTQNNERNTESQEGQTSYVQAFDVVSQNLQLILAAPFVPTTKSVAPQKVIAFLAYNYFDLKNTHYFRILFRLIISPNAP